MPQRDLHDKTILFVTGRLAEPGLRETLSALSTKLGFRYEICVPGIQVAALLHVSLLRNRLEVPQDTDCVIVPGWVQGDLSELERHFGVAFEKGPKDYRDLPEHFGVGRPRPVTLDSYSIEILGEINHATKMSLQDVMDEALALSRAGADVIDVGCVPGESSTQVGEIVRELRSQNLRVSIDSFDQNEVQQAVTAGAELILSCNQSNIAWVSQFGVEVVAIPDLPADTESLDRVVETLDSAGTPFRIDPIIEPIGMGFVASLRRYIDARDRYPDVPMMMGVGNITELAEVDSAGMNLLLAAICEELGIQSVLTTQVINWCRTAIAEFAAARRLVHHAITNQVIPKHLDSSLVMLRDAKLKPQSAESLQALATSLTDANFRIYAEASGLHLMNRTGHWTGENAFALFSEAQQASPGIDAGHAFYLGYELARAEVCRLLGKQYSQDEPLQFGLAGTLRGSAAVHHGRSDFDTDQEPSSKQ